MRINFTLWFTTLTGGVKVIFEVANRLAEKGHEVTITALYGDHKWFPLKVPVIYVKTPRWLSPFGLYTKFRQKRPIRYDDIEGVLRKIGFNIEIDFIKPLAEAIPECDINVATFYPTALAVHRSGKGKGFYYVQHYEPILSRNKYNILMAKETYYLPLTKLVVSRWLTKRIKCMTGDNCIFVGNGVDTEIFHPRSVSLQSRSGMTVMSLFRGVDWKGESEMIDAMNILAKNVPNVKLLGVGKKKAFEELVRSKIVKFKAEFVDSPDDNTLAKLYSSADIFAFPSWYEGFGLPPLESMACGTPVVATSCLGVREFARNEYNALLVPLQDSVELSKAMERVLTDESLIERLRMNGLETARQYTWDKVVDRIEDAFKSVLDRV